MTKGAIAAAINHHSIRDTIARLARVDADELSILNSPLDSIATAIAPSRSSDLLAEGGGGRGKSGRRRSREIARASWGVNGQRMSVRGDTQTSVTIPSDSEASGSRSPRAEKAREREREREQPRSLGGNGF